MVVKNLRVGKVVKMECDVPFYISNKVNYNNTDYYLRFPIDRKTNKIAGEGEWGRFDYNDTFIQVPSELPRHHELNHALYKEAKSQEVNSKYETRKKINKAIPLVVGGVASAIIGTRLFDLQALKSFGAIAFSTVGISAVSLVQTSIESFRKSSLEAKEKQLEEQVKVKKR